MNECRKKATFLRQHLGAVERSNRRRLSRSTVLPDANLSVPHCKRPRLVRFALVFFPLVFALILATGCLNPFAPTEAELGGSLWDDQTTVGGLLENFRTAYRLRDSLRYADLIAGEFVFQYFDLELSRYEQWYRDTELRVTGGLMRNVENLDLRWGPLPSYLDTLSQPDTTIEFTINYSLTAGELASLSGFARFRVRAGVDKQFRIVFWGDDF